ncbi:MAG TPA: hypothetical protein VF400_05810 [Anaeromyxobacteraceae bacterium]
MPERLESVLKEEAQKRRLTVSHLIRNMLEDTFELVDTVVAGAGDLVGDSVVLAEQVAHDAGRIAATVRGAAHDAGKIAATVRGAAQDAGKIATSVRDAVRARSAGVAEAPGVPKPAAETAPAETTPPIADLTHVIAWNQVVVNQAVTCASCGTTVSKGSVAHLGVSRTPATSPTWLCAECLARL